MIWLGVDTSEKMLFVCLYDDEKELYLTSYDAWQRQSEYLVEEIAKAFETAGIKKSDLGAVVSSVGPGSYTGVRIGLTVAKTIAFSLQIPLYLVSSLELLQRFPSPCICLSNARSKRSYFAVYEGGKAVVKDCIKPNDEVRSFIAAHPEYVLCGDLGYLGLEGSSYEPASNYLRCMDEAHLCHNVHSASPVYLKDDYATSPTEMVVRKSIPLDIPALVKISSECFDSKYDEKYWDYEIGENPYAHTYTAIMDNQVVGYIDFMITFSSCTINLIAVKEEYRKKGVGNRLLGQLLKDCSAQKDEEVEFVTLEVRSSNANAISFYKKHQFQQVTVKKGYYDDGEDALYLVRSLIHG